MITIGSDVHLRTTTMTVLNHDGRKMMRKKLNNDPKELLEFIRQFPGAKQFALETCYNWPAFYELFKNEFDDFHLLHAKGLKSIIESQGKCDNHDSDEISNLTHIGYIPKSYIADIHTREFRRLLRTRTEISLQITALKNRIQAIVNAHTFYSQRPGNFKDMFCQRGLLYIQALSLPKQERFIVDCLLKEINHLKRLRQKFDLQIQKVDFHSEDARILTTAPAMKGKIIKYIVLSEIDNIHRFRNSDALIAYAGLIPRNHSSGEKQRQGHLRTDCNHFLKWAMIQSVYPALRCDKVLKQYYQKVKERKNSSAARIAVARRLLTSIYHMLKERQVYFTQVNRG